VCNLLIRSAEDYERVCESERIINKKDRLKIHCYMKARICPGSRCNFQSVPRQLATDAFDLRTLYCLAGRCAEKRLCGLRNGVCRSDCVWQSKPWFAEDTCLTTARRENWTATMRQFLICFTYFPTYKQQKAFKFVINCSSFEVNIWIISWTVQVITYKVRVRNRSTRPQCIAY
jgi:hypothetical protein